jgi:hypothetical protein
MLRDMTIRLDVYHRWNLTDLLRDCTAFSAEGNMNYDLRKEKV